MPERLNLATEAISKLERTVARMRLSLKKLGVSEDDDSGDENQPLQDDHVVRGVY